MVLRSILGSYILYFSSFGFSGQTCLALNSALDVNSIESDKIEYLNRKPDWRRMGLHSERFFQKSDKERVLVLQEAADYIFTHQRELKDFARNTPILCEKFLGVMLNAMTSEQKRLLRNAIHTELIAPGIDIVSYVPNFNLLLNSLIKFHKIEEFQSALADTVKKRFSPRGILSLDARHLLDKNFGNIGAPSFASFDSTFHSKCSTKRSNCSFYGKFKKIESTIKGADLLSFQELEKLAESLSLSNKPSWVITKELIEKINRPESLKFLIQSLMSNPEKVRKIAGRSFYHALGKMRLQLIEVGKVSVVLHFWNHSPQELGFDEFRHNHTADFASYNVKGGAEHFLYRTRKATSREVFLYQSLESRFAKIKDGNELNLILLSLRNIQTENFQHPIYDELVAPLLKKSKKQEKSTFLNHKELEKKLQFSRDEINTLANMAKYYKASPKGIVTETGYIRIEPIVVDKISQGDSYFLEKDIVHKFVPVKKGISIVARNDVMRHATFFRRMDKDQWEEQTGVDISHLKTKSRRIESMKYMNNLLSSLVEELDKQIDTNYK